MMSPLCRVVSNGIIWNQGESNTWDAAEYGNCLQDMIEDWRREMDAPGLPFYIIELAAFEGSELTDNDFGWNRVQKEQKAVADRMEGVFFVPNGDIGERHDIHPQCKDILGERVAKTIIHK